MKEALVLHIPVIHRGYLDLFKKNKGKKLFILGPGLVTELSKAKEIRAVPAKAIKGFVKSLKIFKEVDILEKTDIKTLKNIKVTTVREEISRRFTEKYLSGQKVKFENVFLRWDKGTVKSDHLPSSDRVSKDAFDQEMVSRAANEGDKSSDWWRHVGAVLVKGKTVILESHNQHVPSENTPYAVGDPRDFIEAGKLGFLSTAIHAEQAIIAEAAQKGISIEGANMYLNVFPCLVCARMMAFAGIKKCFFKTGNAYLNVEEALKSRGVEIVRIE